MEINGLEEKDEKIEEFVSSETPIEEFYEENKADIIKEFRSCVDKEQLPEDDKVLENCYIDELLEMAKNWMEVLEWKKKK